MALQEKDIAERRPWLPLVHRPYECLFPWQATSDKPSKPEHMMACRISARSTSCRWFENYDVRDTGD